MPTGHAPAPAIPLPDVAGPALPRSGAVLEVSERDIVRIARARGPAQPILAIAARQAWHEWRIRLATRVSFRHRANNAAVAAYCAMDATEFAGINARQAWANWRTIPRNLTGNLPNRPVRVIDLCCGTGQSTEVLAYYVAPGSTLLGLEYNPRFVDLARQRPYRHAEGGLAEARFVAQSVLETFRDERGAEVPADSVDLVNACGAVGCHFDHEASARLAREVARVLAPGGLALIDSGPAGTPGDDLRGIFAGLGFTSLGHAKSCAVDRYRQLRLRKAG
jgi:SAM-dependent methyltransferase